jgi:glycosyltransferase involved in cell wall biosynthesis
MKVLFIGHTYIVSANRQKLRELGSFDDVELSLVVPYEWSHSLGKHSVDLEETAPYDLYPTRAIFKGHESRYAFFPNIALHMDRIKPDIIHVEQGAQALSYAQAIMSKRVFAPRAKCLFFTWWNLPYALRPHWALTERFNLRHSSYAIAGNRDAMEILRQRGFSRPVKVLPQLGVDTDLYRTFDASDLKHDLGLEGFVVGYAGRLIEQKGLPTLVRAVSKLQAPCTLLLLGRGELAETLLEIARAAGISDSVRIVDTVPHRQVPAYMNCMDAFVLPSLTTAAWKEQFGHVIIEAMACETPVIGSDSGEIPNVIGDAGLVFHEGDATELTQKLQMLMSHPSLCTELAAKGRRRVLENYANKRIAEEIHQIYQEMLEQGPS